MRQQATPIMSLQLNSLTSTEYLLREKLKPQEKKLMLQ
jgi:hypothetical protein